MNSLDDYSVNELSELHISQNNEESIPWFTRTIMGGLTTNNAVIDARQEIEGEANPNFGLPYAFTPLSGYLGISNFVPLMGCDKVKVKVQQTTTDEAIADVAGLVCYDSDFNPISAIQIVEIAENTTYGEIEFLRSENMAFIRYHTWGNSSFLYNHIQLIYSFETLRDHILNNKLLIRKEVVLTKNNGGIGSKAVKIVDGSSDGNSFNHAVMDVENADYVTIRGRIVNFTNSYLNHGGVVLGELKTDGTRPVLGVIYKISHLVTSNSIGYTHTITYKLPKGARQIRWTIHSNNDSITAYLYSEIGKYNGVSSKSSFDVLNVGRTEKKYQYLERISQAKYIDTNEGQYPSVLGLLHFSDFHEDAVAGRLVLEYADFFSSYIDDVISTGDVVKLYLDTGSPDTYLNVKGLAERSLFVLGNHDQAIQSKRDVNCWTNAGGNLATRQETMMASHPISFQRYFANYYDCWGVTMPSGFDDPASPYYQACYWHKDYSNQKIRLIGLDCMYRFDGILAKDGKGDFITDGNGMLAIAANGDGMAKLTTEQETWLKGLLDETLDAQSDVYGYSVVCIAHYPLEDRPHNNSLDANGCNNDYTNGGMVLNHRTHETIAFEYDISNGSGELNHHFNMRNRIAVNNSYGYVKGEVNNMGDILQHFKNNGGKFVAWISGHTHSDHFYYPKQYPDILVVVIDQAGALRDHSETARSVDMDLRMCANYYAIDTKSGLLKIVRLGLTSDRFLRPKNMLCYDYIHRKVISEG